MKDAKIFRIVVASPSDVKKERDAIKTVVEKINRNVASDRGMILEVTRWEDDAFPGFHAEGPQGLIDSVLRIHDCDLVIVVFWMRFGTPVKGARSGTEHEFNEAYKSWKKDRTPQIWVYFKQQTLPSSARQQTGQVDLILEFKRDFPEEGLWWTYNSAVNFKNVLQRNLENYIRGAFPVQRIETAPPPARVFIWTVRIATTIIIAAIIGAFAYWPVHEPVGAITLPLSGAEVDWTANVQGTSQHVATSDAIWIVSKKKEEPQFYPQSEPARRDAAGNWNFSSACIGPREDFGKEYSIIVVVADTTAQAALLREGQTPCQEGVAALPPDAHRLDEVKVIRKPQYDPN